MPDQREAEMTQVKAALRAWTVGAAVLFACSPVPAQETRRMFAPEATARPDEVTSSLAETIRGLAEQVEALRAEVVELRASQRRSDAETAELRRQLALAKSQVPNGGGQTTAGLFSAPPSVEATAARSSVVENETVERERVARIEEDLQLTDAKVNEQYQTKVESGSKYRLRLSGLILLNTFHHRGTADNMDYPRTAVPTSLLGSGGAFGGSLRQSQVGVEVFGPEIAGARTSADVKFDFAGGFPDRPNGVAEGFARLRTGTVRMDWRNTSVVAGQDALFFVPNSPTSLAMVATPPLSYAGNLYSWTPQVRVEQRLTLTEFSTLHLQGGILDSLSGDYPDEEWYGRYPSWGEESKQPAYATRIAWSHHLFGQEMVLGAGGYYGRQWWGHGRNIDGWAATLDMAVPLGSRLGFTGALYRGRAINGLGGGVNQGVVMNASLADPNTLVRGLNAAGGWGQIKFKATPKLEFNGALGIDTAFARDIRSYGGPQS
jgi:hypothetical protein